MSCYIVCFYHFPIKILLTYTNSNSLFFTLLVASIKVVTVRFTYLNVFIRYTMSKRIFEMKMIADRLVVITQATEEMVKTFISHPLY